MILQDGKFEALQGKILEFNGQAGLRWMRRYEKYFKTTCLPTSRIFISVYIRMIIYAYIFVCLAAANIEFQQLLHPFPRKLDLMFWQSFIEAPVSRQVEEELKLDPIEARLSTRPGVSERTLHRMHVFFCKKGGLHMLHTLKKWFSNTKTDYEYWRI